MKKSEEIVKAQTTTEYKASTAMIVMAVISVIAGVVAIILAAVLDPKAYISSGDSGFDLVNAVSLNFGALQPILIAVYVVIVLDILTLRAKDYKRTLLLTNISSICAIIGFIVVVLVGQDWGAISNIRNIFANDLISIVIAIVVSLLANLILCAIVLYKGSTPRREMW